MLLRHSPGVRTPERVLPSGREALCEPAGLRYQLTLRLEKVCPSSALCVKQKVLVHLSWLFSVGLHPGHSRNQRAVMIKTQLEDHVKQGGGFLCTGKSFKKLSQTQSAQLHEEIDIFT